MNDNDFLCILSKNKEKNKRLKQLGTIWDNLKVPLKIKGQRTTVITANCCLLGVILGCVILAISLLAVELVGLLHH